MKFFIKWIMPKSLILFVREAKLKFGLVCASLAEKSGFTSNFYYVFSGAFSNEHRAVLRGRKAYHDSLQDIGETCALLRRNTHRLEKGLIMRPRRDVFAEGFIGETVNCYKNAVKSSKLSVNEKKWATDVLDEYFRIIGSAKEIDKAKKIYMNARCNSVGDLEGVAAPPSQAEIFKPYAYEQLPETTISFEDLNTLFIRRRSVRWYQDKKVPLELVQQASNIASLAPSACNRQPYRFVFSNNKEKAVAIANCAGGTTGFAENLSAIVAIVGDLSAYPFERDRHLIYIDGSLAAMQLMLALETLGLSSCSINWPEVNSSERKIREIIELKDYERVVMLLAIGYADKSGGIPYSQKKTNKLILEDISE